MGKAFSFLCIGMLWILAHQASAGRGQRKCPLIEIENGKARIKSRGRVAKFKCRKGFTMFEGDKFATCIKGRWNGKIPKCITTGCEYYDSIPNGEAVYLYNEALVQFICNPGYVLEGSSALTCNGFGWNDTIPECKAPTDVEYSCDFESDSICGWSNGEHDEFDWTRNRGPTGSFGAGTGPRADHSLGTILGHYMYIGASIPRTDGDRARLYSPVYPASFTDIPSCFAFYYHMYGNTTGDLHIYMKGDTDNIEFMSPIYQMGGSDQENWVLHVIHLHEMDNNFQVVIEAVRGHSYMSDIAIDDVKLAHGEECDELHEEAQKQYQTVAPIITTTSPAPETTSEVEISSESSSRTESTVIDMPSTTISNFILLINGSSTITAQASTVSVLSTLLETTETSSTKDYKSDSTITPEIMSSTATTEESRSTLEPEYNPGSEEDLSSCRNRCGEIAIDADTCGCDIECGHNHSCCLDVEKYCGMYLQTPSPITPVTVATSTSPFMSTAPDSTVEPTSAVVTELESSTLTVPLIITTIVSTTPEITTTPKVSTTSEVPQTESTADSISTKQTPESTVTTAVSRTETTQMTTSMQVFTTITSTTTVEPSEETTTYITPTEATTTEATTTEMTTIETTTASTTKEITELDKAPSTTMTSSTQIFELSTSPIVFTTKGSSTTAVTEKQEVYVTFSTEPGSSGSSSTPSKGSNAATYAIVICTIIIFVVIALLLGAYIRKRRRDKLPEDSDIQFLARDEIMMDGNIFNLSGTITQARNSAI